MADLRIPLDLSVRRPPETITCVACLSDYPPPLAVSLTECGHSFCENCLRGRIKAEESESSSGLIRCILAPACLGNLTQQEVVHLCGPDTSQKLDRRALEHTAQCDGSMYPCPSADCPGIVFWQADMQVLPHSVCEVCGLDRCLLCGLSPYHSGMDCATHKQTVVEAHRAVPPSSDSGGGEGGGLTDQQQEQLTMALLQTQGTRQCRRCKAGVQKTSGCNKMQCRCGYRFCYECLVEDAVCDCTPRDHGFIDNVTGRGDFSNLR